MARIVGRFDCLLRCLQMILLCFKVVWLDLDLVRCLMRLLDSWRVIRLLLLPTSCLLKSGCEVLCRGHVLTSSGFSSLLDFFTVIQITIFVSFVHYDSKRAFGERIGRNRVLIRSETQYFGVEWDWILLKIRSDWLSERTFDWLGTGSEFCLLHL